MHHVFHTRKSLKKKAAYPLAVTPAEINPNFYSNLALISANNSNSLALASVAMVYSVATVPHKSVAAFHKL